MAGIDIKDLDRDMLIKISNEMRQHNLFGIHMNLLNNANKARVLSDYMPYVAIGWPNLGDLGKVATSDELDKLYKAKYPGHFEEKKQKGVNASVSQIKIFLSLTQKGIKKGDFVIYSTPDKGPCHIGRVTSDYIYDGVTHEYEIGGSEYVHIRKVEWLIKNIDRNIFPKEVRDSLSAQRSFWNMTQHLKIITDWLENPNKKEASEAKEPNWKNEPRNLIVFGAPGTGKSYKINKDKEKLLGKRKETNYERVTFHPDYSYANFVGTYKPVSDDEGDISYEYVPGPFMRVYVKARKKPAEPFLLIIEEINRANTAAVFGDVFQLLDRTDDGDSQFPIQASEDIKKHLAKELGGKPEEYSEISIPGNMFIWATMNSADQGVFPMDTAFKRRWDFEYLGIDNGEDNIKGKYVKLGKDEVEWNSLRKAINDFLADKKINEDKQLGVFFLPANIVIPKKGDEIDPETFVKAFKDKVLMYLFEDAAKQKRSVLFPNEKRYSEICDKFDKSGIDVFCDEVTKKYEEYKPKTKEENPAEAPQTETQDEQ